MGLRQSLLHGAPAADLSVTVNILVKDVEKDIAEAGVDVGAVGEALPSGGGDLDLLAALDEVLVQVVGLELGDDAVGALGVSTCPPLLS